MATVRIQVRRGTASDWSTVNPILAAGELGIETNTRKLKVGDGTTAWGSLSYIAADAPEIGEISQDAINTALTMGSGLTKSYNDGANTITISVDSDIVALKSYVDSEITATEGYADSAVSTHNADTTNVHGIANTADLATQDYVDSAVSALGNTADETYVPIALLGEADGVAQLDSNGHVPTSQLNLSTSEITEGLNLYFTAERAQDAAGGLIVDGTHSGLVVSYDDTHDKISFSVDDQFPNHDSDDVAEGSLNLYFTEERVQDVVGNLFLTTGNVTATYDDNAGKISLDTTNNISLTGDLGAVNVVADTVTASTELTAGDVTITGNLTVNGTTTTVNATDLSVTDPMIYMGDGNQSNSLDLGIVTAFNDGTYQHAGLVKDASDGLWKLFRGVTDEPTTTINFAQATYETLKLGGLQTDSAQIGNVTNTEIQYLDGVTSGVQSQLDAKAPIHSPTFTGAVMLPNNTITNAMMTDDAVDTLEIKDDAVTTAKIKDLNVTTAKMSDLSVTTAKINDLAVTAGKLASDSVTTLKIADSSVTSAKIANESVLTDRIANLAVTTGKINDEAVTTDKIGDLNVTTVKINDLAVTVDKLATDAVTTAKIADFNVTTAKINDLAVTNGKLANDAVGTSKIADGSVTADKVASSAVTEAKLAENSVTSGKIANSSITTDKIDNAAVTNAKLAGSIDQSKITDLVSDLAAKAPLASPTFTGTVTLPTGTVTSGMIADGTIVDADINASAAIDWTKLAVSSTVSATELGYVDGVTSSIQTQLDAKLASSTAVSTYAPIASPTFTGTVSGVTKSMVGLGNVDNTSDADKPVSTATQTALDAKLSKSGGTMTGDLTLAGAPTSDLHAATKAYVDNVSSGINFHQPVRVATTGNITLSGTQTIDGVSLSVGDRVLVKDQTTQTQNGIYIVASGSWTRATDADNTPAGELAGGDFCLVLEGTVNSGYGYVCSNTSAITIGTTNVTYAAFNAAKAITAGTGLTETNPGELAVDSSVVQYRVSGVSDTEIGYLDGVTSAIQTQLNAKAPTASPTFTGTVTVAASGIAFTDGTQTKEGVPSRTPINQQSGTTYTTVLSDRDSLVECSNTSAITVTIPPNSSVAYPVGTSIDILQTNTGQVTIAAGAGVTVNATPGLKLRTQWSSATLFKRATDTWIVMGDLSA